MHEAVLAGFFTRQVSACELARDVRGARKRVSAIESTTNIQDMDTRFLVTREMAIALCDAVLNGDLPPEELEIIGFVLVASDNFYWEEEDPEPAETFHDWAAPQINYPLTLENVRIFRDRLARSG